MKRTFLLTAILVCFFLKTQAQIIHIPADQGTIQAGINLADDGDTVLVAEGTYFENINFLGKAITVASLFIQDGDTSHISRTIIDGSQSASPDTASVVTLWSGEDTTSVLMGFTITGGRGTNYLLDDGVRTEGGGGGIFIRGSGALIANNIIEGNHVDEEGGPENQYGGGINVWLYDKHSVIIRKNTIRNNTVTGQNVGGGGVALYGGRVVCEYNEILNNSALAQGWVYGGGMNGFFPEKEGMIREVIVRNNIISGNLASTPTRRAGGGGYIHFYGYGEELTRVYNNVISDNHATYIGGGIFFWDDARARVYNNTIVDNTAGENGKNIVVVGNKELSLYNNIIWSNGNNNTPDFGLYGTDAAKLLIFNNILKQAFNPGDALTAHHNWFDEPTFQSGSFQLAENSPGIGWAFDSLQIDRSWYYAPSRDLLDKPRPHSVDPYLDLGAFESAFIMTDSASILDLMDISLWDRQLEPLFHADTLIYRLSVPDTVSGVPEIKVSPRYLGASIAIKPATDLRSPDPSERTTSITLPSYDGSTQKTYEVSFYLKATDASLSALSVGQGNLNPVFSPLETEYKVWLPFGSKETPGLNYQTTHPKATVIVTPAHNITSTQKNLRTTNISVSPEEGIVFQKVHYIEFNVDRDPPILSLVSDTVYKDDAIKAISTQNGHIYLLTQSLDAILDTLLANMVYSTEAVMNDTASLDTDGLSPGLYWLYATNRYNSVSEAKPVTLTSTSSAGLTNSATQSVSFFPNPVKGLLHIKSDIPISSIELFNTIGVMVMSISSDTDLIKMEHLTRGIYFLKIRTDQGVLYAGKVIKE